MNTNAIGKIHRTHTTAVNGEIIGFRLNYLHNFTILSYCIRLANTVAFLYFVACNEFFFHRIHSLLYLRLLPFTPFSQSGKLRSAPFIHHCTVKQREKYFNSFFGSTLLSCWHVHLYSIKKSIVISVYRICTSICAPENSHPRKLTRDENSTEISMLKSC